MLNRDIFHQERLKLVKMKEKKNGSNGSQVPKARRLFLMHTPLHPTKSFYM